MVALTEMLTSEKLEGKILKKNARTHNQKPHGYNNND
jgi:hypothetical protein